MLFKTLLEKDFIGRSQELEVLSSISSEAGKGIATSIFLSGQHGTGKTELLSHLFNRLFWKQDEVAPFFYTINSAFISPHDFSMDYLNRFICQRIAFQKKDVSLIHAYALSTENLVNLAEKSGASWAVDIIGRHLQTKTYGDTVKLFLSAISAPYQSYLNTGIPVVVIIDEFHRTKEFDGSGSESHKNLWMLFEETIKSRYTPHILTGSHAELQDMLFQKTSLGKHVELFNLSGLNRDASLRLFSLLCEDYNIIVEKESLLPFVDLFNGNPFYIRNLVQAARREREKLSEDNLWKIYFNEIASGKIYTYWVSRLRTYMPQLDLRKSSLEILHHLSNLGRDTYRRSTSTTPADLTSMFLINRKDVDDIVNFFQSAGIIDMGFSTFKLAEDRVLTDVIRGIYSKEILEEPLDITEEIFMKERYKHVKTTEAPSFEVTIPTIPKAELIAVSALEQIARNQNISTEVAGELQIALIDLLTNIIAKNEPHDGNLHLRFERGEGKFIIEIKTPYQEPAFPASSDALSQEQLIRKFTDTIELEKTKSGTKITLTKNLKLS
jgi:hypothetical protein